LDEGFPHHGAMSSEKLAPNTQQKREQEIPTKCGCKFTFGYCSEVYDIDVCNTKFSRWRTTKFHGSLLIYSYNIYKS
jgi:hypothetical protein